MADLNVFLLARLVSTDKALMLSAASRILNPLANAFTAIAVENWVPFTKLMPSFWCNTRISQYF